MEAEQMVLEYLLFDSELIRECHLTDLHFSMAVNRVIFKLIRRVQGVL
ncbi:DnaB-like helicase N-terminal domain-containing protein [Bacillus sp. 166amftsu]